MREGEAISPSRDEERRRKRERGEEEREKRGEERKISPSSCYARARVREQGGEETSRERPCSPSRERLSVRGREERKRGRERERIKRERVKRERVKKYVDKTWQPRGGRNKKTVHLSGNPDVVPQSGHRKRWCHNLDLK